MCSFTVCPMCVSDDCFVYILFVQFGETRRVLQVLRTLLEEFREELREEEARRCQLQQSYANDKAAWEVKWAEMKCHVAQVQMASQHPPLKGQDTICFFFFFPIRTQRKPVLFSLFSTCELTAPLWPVFRFESKALE